MNVLRTAIIATAVAATAALAVPTAQAGTHYASHTKSDCHNYNQTRHGTDTRICLRLTAHRQSDGHGWTVTEETIGVKVFAADGYPEEYTCQSGVSSVANLATLVSGVDRQGNSHNRFSTGDPDLKPSTGCYQVYRTGALQVNAHAATGRFFYTANMQSGPDRSAELDVVFS